jgi:hypothetical protein
MQAAIAHLHSQAIQIHSYMDNSLIKELSPEKHQCSHQTVSLSGVSHLMEKVRPNSFSGLHLSRRTFPYSTGLSSSSTGKVSESLFESSSVSVSENSYFSPIFTTARSFEFSSRRCSTWSPSHSTTSFFIYTNIGVQLLRIGTFQFRLFIRTCRLPIFYGGLFKGTF